MADKSKRAPISRRDALEQMGKLAAMSVVAGPFAGKLRDGFAVTATPVPLAAGGAFAEHAAPLAAIAGVDRVVMKQGKTYLSGWAGYGTPPRPGRGGRGAPPEPQGPIPTTRWSTLSGPGDVTFADPNAATTTATFSKPGEYVLQVAADNGSEKATSTLAVKVELPPPPAQLAPVVTRTHKISSPLWKARTKAIITSWIPHIIEECESTAVKQGPGGLDNFVEAAKALRGEPYAPHKGYVFSNAWVHQTVESMSLALMVDAEGDAEILAAQQRMRDTLERWIPIILAAQHPDGYLQTAYTLRDALPAGQYYPAAARVAWTQRWQASARPNHEGYVSGYFIESAINHYSMTNHKDARLYNAAKKLADCWADNIGPAPKQEWFDGHQEMEQALVRFGRFVNEIEGQKKGDRYIALAKFLLDCRKNGSEYDQSHLPVQQQYEAVGHAVRAVYTYSGMADVAVETHDADYQSAVKSIWDNIVHRKYYVTGGVASGESSEGFGANYSLRNNAYCEACSSCGEIFFQWKLHLAYHDAQYADLYEQTLYNALLGALDLEGKHFFYTNPLDQNSQRTSWHSVPCCTGNIPRTLLMLPTWMYSKDKTGIYVNLFAGSTITVEDVAGTHVELVQDTNYPWDGKVSITLNPAKRTSFAMRIRVPTRDVSELYTAKPKSDGVTALAVNGKSVKLNVVNGYAVIERAWNAGDKIEFELPMTVQRVYASEKIAADVGKVAIRRGPIVYVIEKVDQEITNAAVPTSSALTNEWRGDLLGGVMVVKGTFADGSAMTAIPYYTRYNRNPPAAPWTPPPPAPATPPPPPPAGAAAPPRPQPRPPEAIVWIRES